MWVVWAIIMSEQLQIPTEVVQYAGDDFGYYSYNSNQLTSDSFARPGYNYEAVANGNAEPTSPAIQ